jgi:hypothetical protein
MDAHAALLVFRGLARLHHPYRTHQGLQQHTFTYDARRPQPSGRNGSGGANGRGGDGGANGGGNGGQRSGRHSQAAGAAIGAGMPASGSSASHGSSGGKPGGGRHVSAACWPAASPWPVSTHPSRTLGRRLPAAPAWASLRQPVDKGAAAAASAPPPPLRCWQWRMAPLLRRALTCRAAARLPLTCLL